MPSQSTATQKFTPLLPRRSRDAGAKARVLRRQRKRERYRRPTTTRPLARNSPLLVTTARWPRLSRVLSEARPRRMVFSRGTAQWVVAVSAGSGLAAVHVWHR